MCRQVTFKSFSLDPKSDPRRVIDAVGQRAAVEIGNEGRLGMEQLFLELTAGRERAGVACGQKALDQCLICFHQGHDIAQPYLAGVLCQNRTATAATPRVQIAPCGQRRDDFGQMIARDAEFFCKLCCGEGPVRLTGHAHQHTQAKIRERGKAQGMNPVLVFALRI